MSDDQFTRLFRYIEEFRAETNERFEKMATKESVDRLTNTIDGFLKRLDDYEVELAARDSKINRLEKYIEVLAEKAGVDLDSIKV